MGYSLKKMWKDTKKAAGAAASTGIAVATAGTVQYDANTGGIKVNTNVEDAAMNLGDSLTGGKYIAATAPKPPGMPTMEDPALQAKRAEAEANAKVAEQAGAKTKGLSSTVLGGSISEDQSVLKKRKLLGE